MSSDIRLQPKKAIKKYHYTCDWCNFDVDDDEPRMALHCLKKHGVTGVFKKGYSFRVRRTFKT